MSPLEMYSSFPAASTRMVTCPTSPEQSRWPRVAITQFHLMKMEVRIDVAIGVENVLDQALGTAISDAIELWADESALSLIW